MAALANTNPTFADLAAATDPDGTIANIVELLSQANEMLLDMTWIEGNLPTGHRTTVRTGLPPVTWRAMYGGVQPGKSASVTITDNTGMLEAYGVVDKALADLNGNTAAFRLSEEMSQIAALANELQRVLIYGNEGTIQESFTGLTPRYNANSGATNALNVILGSGASTDNASIWLVYWGPLIAHGIVPKGSKAGLQVEDKGLMTHQNIDGAGGFAEVYTTHYRWDAGLTVRDWRGIVRICNISKGTLTKNAATGDDLADLMFQALEAVPPQVAALGRPAFYMSRNTMSFLRRQLVNKTAGSTLTIENVGGKQVYSFSGIPIRRCDSMAASEALVT